MSRVLLQCYFHFVVASVIAVIFSNFVMYSLHVFLALLLLLQYVLYISISAEDPDPRIYF